MADLKTMINAYIPSPRDETLEPGEYYYLQYTSGGERVIRVFALDILPLKDGTEYGIYQQRGGELVRINVSDDPFRGARMADLYDNRDDCKYQTHRCYDGWERLREAMA